MKNNRTTVVDFIARGDIPEEWKMVLVEEGPWSDSIESQLRRIQDRLYGCIDAAIDGQLAELYPDSTHKIIVIQLDCYDLPRNEVTEFFDRFSNGVFLADGYRQSIKDNAFVKGIKLEINFN